MAREKAGVMERLCFLGGCLRRRARKRPNEDRKTFSILK